MAVLLNIYCDTWCVSWERCFLLFLWHLLCIDRGRFSLIKKCVHRMSGQEVAAKMVSKRLMSRADAAVECNVLLGLQHSALVQPLSLYETSTSHVIILPLWVFRCCLGCHGFFIYMVIYECVLFVQSIQSDFFYLFQLDDSILSFSFFSINTGIKISTLRLVVSKSVSVGVCLNRLWIHIKLCLIITAKLLFWMSTQYIWKVTYVNYYFSNGYLTIWHNIGYAEYFLNICQLCCISVMFYTWLHLMQCILYAHINV